MSNQKAEAYARALFEIAQAEGALERVEDELFRVARAFESNDQLRSTLTDATLPADRRQQVVEQLLGGKASATTVQLVSMLVTSGQVKEMASIIDALVKRASSEKSQEVAEVRSAIPLTDDQQKRLAAALTKATGKALNLKVVVDPSVLGGLVAVVGDEVIDDTVRTRLDQLKTRI
ncbi:MAG: ATP synthase F1 subunit delta [Ilumatobacteraceae bacterium]|jgi:F-type H+-transporting ATPase subunit delta